jgi:anti-sigma regulatory factor (Ser/Thr protein kinase)
MTLLSVVSDNPRDLQILVNQAVQYSITHRYKLQPQKSVVIEVNKKGRKQQDKNLPLKINQDDKQFST